MGDTLPTRVPEGVVASILSERQLRKTRRTLDGHLLWRGARANGYPAARYEGKTVYLKRLIWEELHGPVPEDMVVTSACRVRDCVEPSHLALMGRGRYAWRRDLCAFTGFEPIDDILGPLLPGQVVLVAGRPGSGKTRLALEMARNVAVEQRKKVVFFSLELPEQAILARAPALEEACVVADTFGLREIARRTLEVLEDRGRFDLLVVDYLQLATHGGGDIRALGTFHVLAIGFATPVLLTSQLPLRVSQREDPRPHLSDVTPGADKILLLHNEGPDPHNPKRDVVQVTVGAGHEVLGSCTVHLERLAV